MPTIDATRAAEPAEGWAAKVRTRPVMLAVAFAIGVATAATFHLSQRPGRAPSVMLDQDLTHIAPRSPRSAAPVVPPISAPTGAGERSALPPRAETGRTRIASESEAAGRRRVAQAGDSGKPVMVAVAGAPPATPAAFDRVLALSYALDACAKEPLFARLACEHRARTQYCAGIEGQVAQCSSPPPRDHGQ